MEKYLSIIESVLFVTGESVTVRRMAEILELDIPETRRLLLELQRQMEVQRRGIRLTEINQGFQMTTAQEHSVYIEKLCKQSRTKGLSAATMEVLAIVAYKQPLTRTEIEAIRGVSCEKAIKTLLERELLDVKERPGGKGFLYTTNEGFLRTFGLKNLKDLPVMDSFRQLTFDEVSRNVSE